MRRHVEQPLAQRHCAIDIDDHGDAAPARLGAKISTELRAAAFGQDSGAVVQQCLGGRQMDLPQFGIAERDDAALAARIDHDGRDRSHQARHAHDMLGLDALMREVVEDKAARGLARVAHWSADRGTAAEADDADRGIERVAAADLVEMGGVLLGAAGGHAADTERQVAHRHADAEDARRDFRRGSVKVHTGIRHAGSACCRNQCPELIDWSMELFPAMRRRRFPHAPSAQVDDARSQTDAVPQGRPDAAA